MEELRETIWRLSNLDRGPLIDALLGMDAEQQAIACGSGRRAELGSSARNRAEKARSNCFPRIPTCHVTLQPATKGRATVCYQALLNKALRRWHGSERPAVERLPAHHPRGRPDVKLCEGL